MASTRANAPGTIVPTVYASIAILRWRLQDSRPGWIRCLLSSMALSSPTTCRFIPALSEWPTARSETMGAPGPQIVHNTAKWNSALRWSSDTMPTFWGKGCSAQFVDKRLASLAGVMARLSLSLFSGRVCAKGAAGLPNEWSAVGSVAAEGACRRVHAYGEHRNGGSSPLS
jgi:hypothetical protein